MVQSNGEKRFISRLKLPVIEPQKIAIPVKEGDVETWSLVAREPLQDRLAQIAALCKNMMNADVQPSTAYGLARDVLTIADAEIEARDRKRSIKDACSHTYIIKNGVDVCVVCNKARPL